MALASPQEFEARTVFNLHSHLGEGALWDPKSQTLFWIDITPGLLHQYNPATQENKTWEMGRPIGCVVMRESGGVVVALEDGFAFVDLPSGRISPIADPEPEISTNRFNDGKCDPAGRFWAGTMDKTLKPHKGALYMLDTDLRVHKKLEQVSISNGITWSLDGKTMYFIDSEEFRLDAFDFDVASGAIAGRRPVVHFPREWGYPDGSCMDGAGRVWVAFWGSGCVRCFDPAAAGAHLYTVHVRSKFCTSCAFGDADLGTLYITSARQDDPGAEAGAVFAVRVPDVVGVPSPAFRG